MLRAPCQNQPRLIRETCTTKSRARSHNTISCKQSQPQQLSSITSQFPLTLQVSDESRSTRPIIDDVSIKYRNCLEFSHLKIKEFVIKKIEPYSYLK